jgi:cytochrome oxidase Cu insertion factor (SCO1/SenC/PrrC family)
VNFLKDFAPGFVQEEKAMKIRKILFASLAATVLIFFASTRPALAIGIGDQAPDFELDSTKGGKVKLSSLKGKTVLINFYNFDFSAT